MIRRLERHVTPEVLEQILALLCAEIEREFEAHPEPDWRWYISESPWFHGPESGPDAFVARTVQHWWVNAGLAALIPKLRKWQIHDPAGLGIDLALALDAPHSLSAALRALTARARDPANVNAISSRPW